jgi:hypothetical protein
MATIVTQRTVATTLTCPPARTTPPVTGAAKDRISQSSPMVGWPSSNLATSITPASAAKKSGQGVGADDRREDRNPGQFRRIGVAPTAKHITSEWLPVENVQATVTTRTVGRISQGTGWMKIVLPNAFTLSGTP